MAHSISRPIRIVIWIAVFAACAGAGAYVAAHTDPFPPGVEDPGSRPGGAEAPGGAAPTGNADPTGEPAAEPPSWRLGIVSATSHRFRVGGSCRTDWRAKIRLELAPDGAVAGAGPAHLVDGLRCDFPVAQIQATSIDLGVNGTWERTGRGMTIRLLIVEIGRDPAGSRDLGGLASTLRLLEPELRSTGDRPIGSIGADVRVERDDGDGGTWFASYALTARCLSGCP